MIAALFFKSSYCGKNRSSVICNLGKMDASGRMLKWAVENWESEISYEPRNAIKDQALANFIWETTRRGGGTSLGVVCRWNGDKAMSMSRYCFSKPK